MRLHHLQVTAFGPFADTVEVDFDELSGAGLFLLSGATGSGKTSILDAVCFALYGDVPGDRNTAKRFRSDLAASGVAPRVRLETTLAGRRFRLTRSPAWTRPKKRGSGLTTEHASVLLEERVDGEWVAQSTRLDEAGHLVTDLVGMTMPQFCQVAMLPQGRFQTFLRARSEERHRLLQQLFSTQRFEDVERWLRDRARSLHRESRELQRAASRVVSRLLEAADRPLPEAWSLDDLAPQLADDALPQWAASVRDEATTVAAEAETSLTQATQAEQSAREAREAGHRVAELQARARGAAAALDDLSADDEQHRARQQRLLSGRRAAPVLPLHRLSTATRERHHRAVNTAAEALTVVEQLTGLQEPTADELSVTLAELRADHTLTSQALTSEQELQTLHRRITDAEARVADLEQTESDALERSAALPVRVEELGTKLRAARDAATEATSLSEETARLEKALAAAATATTLRAQLAEATEERRLIVDECQSLKEDWLALTEARIRGMAAEIATDLAVGASCPVCGSAEHPHKAQPVEGSPSAETEKAARKALDDAEVIRTAREAKVHELASSLRLAEHEAGPEDPTALAARLDDANRAHAAASAVARTAGEIETAMVMAQRSLQSATATLAETKVALAEQRTRLDHDRQRADEIDHELGTLLEDTGHDDLESLLAHQARCIEACETAVRLATDATAARDEAERAETSLQEWLAEHDFDDVHEALAAVLPDHEAAVLEEQVADHGRRLASARAALEDPAVIEAQDVPEPDLAALDADAERLREALARARGAAEDSRRRATRLGALHDELGAAVDAWRPVLDSYATTAELASFVEGKSADNELRMRLSAYVLAWRLTQVVAAANERLLHMTDRRYTLEHTDRRGAGETRGGLSLLVLDEWSGEHRDPATLSGGETFLVSLALALGLADVVTQEAGGAELDTLFVDEGFGTLDSDTLDDVMDTLDTLRDGGRVVGVVSHVAEMRSRIPTQLVVAKHRGHGSSVTVTHDAV